MILLAKVLLVFFATATVDFAWSMYIMLLAEKKTFKAACWSAFITLAGGIVAIEYIKNYWMLIPAVIGGFIGTYLSKYFIKEKK